MNGLVLTAGGARGAYQAGVLRRLSEVRGLRDRPLPFAIVAGASAGAINGAMMAAWSPHFHDAAKRLSRLWSQLRVEDVIRTDTMALASTGADLLLDFAFGGIAGAGRVKSLFDASPLRALLQRSLPFRGIGEAIRSGHLHAVAVTATSYHSGKSYTFIEGVEGHATWLKRRRVTHSVHLGIDHVLASAAIPIVFPPIAVACGGSTLWFGDGALRLAAPLSPAIRLGAERVLAIGVRCPGVADDLTRDELERDENLEASRPEAPPLAQICGVFLNAVFLDHLDADVDHLERMNELIAAVPRAEERLGVMAEPVRPVEPLVISPSEDLAMVARTLEHRMPSVIRYVLDGLGTPDAQSADLLSYLLFDSHYTRELVDIGYRDASARIDELEEFVRGGAPADLRAIPQAPGAA